MSPRTFIPFAVFAVLAMPAFSQIAETNAKEEERLEQLLRNESSDWYTPKTTVSVGFRVLSSGGNVRFGNLGSIPFNVVAPASDGLKTRVYNDGTVNVDAPRTDEVDSLGNQTSTPGGRYKIGAAIAGDYLSYTPGLTRSWTFSTAEQAATLPGYIAMNNYSAESSGGSFSKKQGISPGVELQFARAIRKLTKKTELSLVAGIALNGINDKTAGDVNSTLLTDTDFYSLHGQTAPTATPAVPYLGPHYSDAAQSIEDTVTIGATPDPTLSTHTSTPDGVVVHGRWQIKGAYFMVRLGPSIRTQLTDHLGISASLGAAGAYAGTAYSAAETMEVPIVGTTIATSLTDSNTTKFLGGYYADINVEWSANETLNLYGGVSAQKLGSYDQELDGRTAHVDFGTSVGLRGGINIKF